MLGNFLFPEFQFPFKFPSIWDIFPQSIYTQALWSGLHPNREFLPSGPFHVSRPTDWLEHPSFLASGLLTWPSLTFGFGLGLWHLCIKLHGFAAVVHDHLGPSFPLLLLYIWQLPLCFLLWFPVLFFAVLDLIFASSSWDTTHLHLGVLVLYMGFLLC